MANKNKLEKKELDFSKKSKTDVNISGWVNVLYFLFSAFFFLFLFRYYLTGTGGPTLLAVTMVPTAFAIIILNLLRKNQLYPKLGVNANYIIAALYIILAIVVAIYLRVEFEGVRYARLGNWNTTDVMIGSIMIVFVMEYARKRSMPIFILNLFLIFYSVYGWIFPGMFSHPGLSWYRVLTSMGVEIATGVFSRLPQLGLTLIGSFLMVLSVLMGFGCIDSILKFASKLATKSAHALPQAAVMGSFAVGTVSGSGAANAATTGSATIPAMIQAGFPRVRAAAIETASSLGSQLMPPIMGITAFLMVEFMGVSYFEVIARGFAPALIYFFGVSISVFLLASRYKTGMADLKAPQTGLMDLVNIFVYLAVVGLLVYFMGVLRIAPLVAAVRVFMGISAFLFLAYVINMVKIGSFNFKALFRPILKIIDTFGEMASDLVLLLSLLGILSGAFVITGIPTKVGLLMMDAAAFHIIAMILVAFIFGYLIGMGLPAAPTYIVLVLAIAPPMVRIGVDLWVVHFFAFFVAVFGELSPPTSVTAAVTSKIAGANYTMTILRALELCIPLMILMFAVFSRPGLVVQPGVAQIMPASQVFIGTVGIIFSIHGKYSKKWLNEFSLKALLIVLSLIIIFHPNVQLATIAMIPSIILIVYGVILARKGDMEIIEQAVARAQAHSKDASEKG